MLSQETDFYRNIYILLYKEDPVWQEESEHSWPWEGSTMMQPRQGRQTPYLWDTSGRKATVLSAASSPLFYCFWFLDMAVWLHALMLPLPRLCSRPSGLPPWTRFSVTQPSEFSTHLSKPSCYPNRSHVLMGNGINVSAPTTTGTVG